ncbi:MAG TPA: hypothetical protein VK133_02260 [Amoebophilaceae bacterium]|nr:hypothetical protein [Amoebophilaceae bacterium]
MDQKSNQKAIMLINSSEQTDHIFPVTFFDKKAINREKRRFLAQKS